MGEGAHVKRLGGDVKLICTILSPKSHEIEETSIRRGVGIGGGGSGVGGLWVGELKSTGHIFSYLNSCFTIARPTALWYLCERKVSLIAFAATV